MMPTYERRYFLSLKSKQLKEREEKYEEMKSNSSSSGKSGTKKTKISGDALKAKMKNGDIPLN